MQDVNAHLDMNLDKEYAVFSTSEATGKGFIYSVDNMNTLEQTFQKVWLILLQWVWFHYVISSLRST